MDYKKIIEELIAEPSRVAFYLSCGDIELTIAGFDAFISAAKSNKRIFEEHSKIVISILCFETVPNLMSDNSPICREALCKIIEGIRELVFIFNDKDIFVPVFPQLEVLILSPSPSVKASAMRCLGSLIRAHPTKSSEKVIEKLSDELKSPESRVRVAALNAWGEIVESSPLSARKVTGKIQELLTDPTPMVRAEAAGYFKIIAEKKCPECASALPILRFLRDKDPDELVRERASAAIQAITDFISI